MNLLRTFDTGMRGLLGHRLRSILTTLGILFGVAAVICTVGIGTASADFGQLTNRRARHQPPHRLAREARRASVCAADQVPRTR